MLFTVLKFALYIYFFTQVSRISRISVFMSTFETFHGVGWEGSVLMKNNKTARTVVKIKKITSKICLNPGIKMFNAFSEPV